MSGPRSSAPANQGGTSVRLSMARSAIANLAIPFVALVVSPLLARAFGVEGRGAVAAASAPLFLATTIGLLGLPEALTYFTARNRTTIRALLPRSLLLLLLSGTALTLLMVAFRGYLSNDDPRVSHLITLAALATIPTLLLACFRGVSQGLGLWNLVNAEKYVTGGLRLGGIVLLYALGALTPDRAILILSFAPVLGGIGYIALRVHGRGRGPAAADDAPDTGVKELVTFGATVFVGSLSGVLLTRLDQVLMTPLSSTYALGIYVVAVNLSEVVLIPHFAVKDVSFASEATTSNDARLLASGRRSFLLSTMTGLGIGALCPLVIPRLFGSEFSPAVPVTIVLLVASVTGIPGSIAGAGLAARGRPEVRSLSLLAACVINVLCLLVLVPRYGAMGAAVATLVGNTIAANVNIAVARRLYGHRVRDYYLFGVGDLLALIHLVGDLLPKAGSRP